MATRVIDRGYRAFYRLRSTFVVACGSDQFFDTYNNLAYARNYRMVTKGLFPFEQRAISRHFPAPPATVLIGGAGAGREALVLAQQGYRVVAFEPIQPLAISLAEVRGALPIDGGQLLQHWPCGKRTCSIENGSHSSLLCCVSHAGPGSEAPGQQATQPQR